MPLPSVDDLFTSQEEELRAEGFAILSEFVRKNRAPNAREAEEEGCGAEKAQVVPRTGKSVSGPATSGKATSGKPRAGEPGAINYSWDKAPESNQLPPPPPRGKPGPKGKATASSPTGEASSPRSSRGSARCRSSPSHPSGSRGPETLARHMAACEERYGRYLALCDSMEGGVAAGRRVAS